MKKVIITLAVGDIYKQILAQTMGLLRKYARRIDAELKIVTADDPTFKVPHYRKLKLIKDELLAGNRVAWIDCDVLISEKAPDIFSEVPEDQFGIFNEGFWNSRVEAMEYWSQLTGFQFPSPFKYFNTGVMVASPQHADIFNIPDLQVYHYGEQTYLNQRIFESNCKIFELSHHWNRMSITHKPLGEDVFCSHFIHFAGETGNADLPAFIKRTVEEWNKRNWTGDKRIVIVAGGGMGNQIATLPVIEYAMKQHPDYKFTIQSAFTDVFQHLSAKGVEILDRNSTINYPFALVKSTQFNHNAEPPLYDVFCHPTDYHSTVLFHKQLPFDAKNINLPTKDCGVSIPKGTIAIHPGRSGWPSKEMPQEYWQKIVDILKARKFKIALIGTRHFIQKSDLYDPKNPKTAPQQNAWGCFELTNIDYNFLDAPFAETCDVISKCDFMLSNDSMPVHAAGAFDKYIGLITIAKRPELIFPYRNGSNSYKTISWTGVPMWELESDALMYCPGKSYDISTMKDGMKWPEPHEIAHDIIMLLK